MASAQVGRGRKMERQRIEGENITLENFSPQNFFEAFLRIVNEGQTYKVEEVKEMKTV